jgi:formylmethanofuran dehydrogenase subunit E
VSRTESYRDVIDFHGHDCPGAGIGVLVAELAVSRLGRHSASNEIVALSETDICAVDAIQVLTGCTFGRRNLVHQDNGKYAFTFWRRAGGKGLRIMARPGSDAFRDERTWALADKIADGTATDADRQQFAELQAARVQRILAADAEDLLMVEESAEEPPKAKPLYPSAPCDGCGELTSTQILHNHRGKMMCPPCHLAAHGGVLPPDHAHHNHAHHNHAHHNHEHGHHHH